MRGIDLRDSNPRLPGERLEIDSPNATIRFNADMHCLTGFGIDVQGTATAPINPGLYFMRPSRNLKRELSASLDGAAFDSVNLEGVGANRIPIFS
jgi:hypothetical protein